MSEQYKKDKGAAGIHGQNFEYMFCALLFLRARNKGYNFKLASNVEGYGKFDDVVVEYLDGNSRIKHIFLQLKSKMKQKITMQQLLAGKGDFSLYKYYESYVQIEEKFNCSEAGVKMDGRIDESLFIIYTNADVPHNLISHKVPYIGEEEFLMTGGSVLQFNEEEHKAIYQHLQELPKHREFFSRFRIFYSQAKEKEMECQIKRELQRSMKLPEGELDLIYKSFISIIQNWWQNCNYFLQGSNCEKIDPLLKTSEEVRPTLVAKILNQRKSELDELTIKYKQSAITDMEQVIDPHKAVLIFAPGRSTTLTAAKIHQMLSTTEHIILNLQQFVRYKAEVILAWKCRFDVLVLESDSSAEVFPGLFIELRGFLNNGVAEKKFIFVSNNVGNIEQINELRHTFHTNLTERYDVCKFTDIVTESQMLFLDKKVYFQGVEVKLSTIVKNDDVGVLNALDCDSISLLLENEKPSIGIRSEDTVENYIDRTLQSSWHAKTCFPALGEIQHALSRDILQKMRDSSPHFEENFERERETYWKPSTLIDGGGHIILVTDEPGMGKSTFLTHLAKETQKRHPNLWIVRVNINNYTRVLHEFKRNGCDQKGTIKLLTEAAQIKENDALLLEGRLFNYTYNSTGNMAVLIDGVDEVSPHYTEEVIQVLKILSKTKIKRIWVTSRNSVKDRLETEFQCQSYSLVPFSEEDQKRFLVKFWNKTCLEKKDNYLENLANRVVQLSTEHLTVQAKKFMGIPLQSLLLAEMFEGNLKQCSSAGTVELPEYINVVMLYDLYVEKKWDIYLSEKKKSDRTNVNALSDDEALHKTFVLDHMAAALVAILSSCQLEKLTDKTITKGVRAFLQKITEGIEKTGIIIDVIEERPVFQHRTLAEYFVARWLCDNISDNISAIKIFVRDNLFESGFGVIRSMVDSILADKCPLHDAVLNSDMRYVARLLERKESIKHKDRGGRTPLHVAVSCRIPELIRLLLEHGADVSSVDTLLELSPVEYAIRIADWEVLSLMMEKRPGIREQVLNGTSQDSVDCITHALRAAAQYGRNYLLIYLINKGKSVNTVLPGDKSNLIHVAARSQQTETVKVLLLLGASIDCQDESGKTPLHVSVETGNFEVIKCLVEHQEPVQSETELKHVLNSDRTDKKENFLNVPDVYGNTPLHLSVAAGNTNIMSYLINAGSDKNTCNMRGDYPLTLAARCGKNDIVELLMVGEVQCEEAKIAALTAAIVSGHMETTDLLVRLGFPVNKGENGKPIHVASRMGHKEMVSLLLQYGASLTSRTDSGNTALHLASEAGHLTLVKYLVELQTDGLYSLNYENETPMHVAARNGRDYIVTYFAENGCNINASSTNGATCLHVACENGHYTTVECLLKHGAEVNAMNSADQTPLHIAASRGQTKIVELLFLHNANFSLRDKEGITALLAASINGHQDTVRFIVQHGGNIEDTDGKGNTIAHCAVENENCDILNFLSQRNVSLDVQNSDGDTPLLKAVREGRNRMVQYLVERNCDTNTEGNDGMLPVDVAVLKGNMEITRILLESNASSGKASTHIVAAAKFGFVDLLQRFVDMGDDINVKADNGESPLHAACESGQVATVQYLCEHGAILDWQDNNGNTALHVAVSNGHLDTTRVLVEKGANLCAADASGSTALHIAAKGGYLNIVQYLADSFAPIDRRNGKNETALLVAAAEGNEKIVSVLIEVGAGIGVRDIGGKTALDIATDKGYADITKLLQDRAEGRKIVASISHTEINTALESGDVECLKRKMNAGTSARSVTDRNDSDSTKVFKTTAEDTLQFQSNPRSALHTAAVNGNLEEVQRLEEAGIALDCGDPFGRTALWGAAKSGHKFIIRYLLQNGSCVNIPDCEGVRPTDIAVREGHWGAVNEFVEHDPTLRPEGTEYLRNQLYEASESGDLDVVRIILKCGITVNTTNQNGNTPLHVAAMSGHKEVTSFLLKCGANVNTADSDGKTPLFVAVEKGRAEIFREALSATAVTNFSTPFFSTATGEHREADREMLIHSSKVNIADKIGDTPLYIAGGKGHADVVRELLKHGANVDTADKDGDTPLYIAGGKGHVEVVRELLKHGANVNTANKNCFTPLYVAGRNGNVEVVRELLNHGANMITANKRGVTPLYIAAGNGHVEVVRELLKHGANVNTADKGGDTALHIAGRNGHVEVVREFLKHGASVNTADKDGDTALHIAGRNGHVEVVREFLNHGAKVNTANKRDVTPLYIAAGNGHIEVVREFLNHVANVNNADEIGYTPLYVAGWYSHVEMVRELLKHGANVNTADKGGDTVLHIAARNGHVEVVREFLNHGAKVNTANKRGVTPLYIAAGNGHIEVVRELLKIGANVNTADKDGDTALHIAGRNGHVDVVREFLNHGAKVNTANKRGVKPLYIAGRNGHVEVVRELLKHCANVNTADKDGDTALHIAGRNGHIEVVREFLNHGATVNTANKRGVKPLYMAGSKGHVEVVRELLKHGANVNTADKDGDTALHIAGRNGHVEVVREFLNHGADVNTANKEGFTPMHITGRNGHVEVVRDLLNHGANVNTVNKDGFSPLYVAGQEGHIEVVRELLNHDANVNTADKHGFTPLYVAGVNSHIEVVREFLKHGAKVDTSKLAGLKFIDLAAEKGYLDLIRDVLK